ncbi:helix-turn-helix domain-containing protein [Vibrio jasicida]|uniref:helix-turn-helix domain-containing protein n=1 Tax=Vibrio jasicida TaxID=766224 RepID=UPI004067D568
MFINVEFHFSSLKIVAQCVDDEGVSRWIKYIRLSRSEYFILKALVLAGETHLSKNQLVEVGWPLAYVCANSLNMAVMSLRKKLMSLGNFWEISTIHRFGYGLSTTLEFNHIQIHVEFCELQSSRLETSQTPPRK